LSFRLSSTSFRRRPESPTFNVIPAFITVIPAPQPSFRRRPESPTYHLYAKNKKGNGINNAAAITLIRSYKLISTKKAFSAYANIT